LHGASGGPVFPPLGLPPPPSPSSSQYPIILHCPPEKHLPRTKLTKLNCLLQRSSAKNQLTIERAGWYVCVLREQNWIEMMVANVTKPKMVKTVEMPSGKLQKKVA
jgi:hypothetical protein